MFGEFTVEAYKSWGIKTNQYTIVVLMLLALKGVPLPSVPYKTITIDVSKNVLFFNCYSDRLPNASAPQTEFLRFMWPGTRFDVHTFQLDVISLRMVNR